jgi:hypothetical protein
MTDKQLTGGCQCGAVRYALTGPPQAASVCHCRMCQKASGGPLMAFTRVRKSELSFLRGVPATFRSSTLVERGFCPACGTPLTYDLLEGPNISVTINSLDDPQAVTPTMRYCASGAPDWFDTILALPVEEEFFTQRQKGRFVSHQHPDEDGTPAAP